MKAITFYGASDDLVEVEGDVPGCDEHPAPMKTERVDFAVSAGEESMTVSVQYAYNGIWTCGYGPGEHEDLPAWPVKFEPQGYTMRMTVECPDDVQVLRISGSD